MKKELIPEADDRQVDSGSKGNSRRLLLLVLLLLTVTFGYLYFFTSLIKPHEEAITATPVQTAQVKKPIPPRPEQANEKPAVAAKPEEKPAQTAAVKPVTSSPAAQPKAAQPSPVTAKPVTSKPVPAPTVAKPVTAPVAKPASVPQHPPVKVAKVETPQAGKEHGKAQPAKPQQSAVTKPVASAKQAPKKTAEPAKAEHRAAKPAVEQGTYTLLVGEYAIEREMKNRRTSLKKLGLTPIHSSRAVKSQTMHRLYLAGFDSHYAADQELQKLLKAAGSAFILQENGRFAVYAGSFVHKSGADSERKRLAGKGFQLSTKTAKLMLPVTRITAGSFTSSADAEKEAVRLLSHGIRTKVIKTGKLT